MRSISPKRQAFELPPAEERTAALRAIAGDTDFGRARSATQVADLRKRGIVLRPTDLGIDPDAVSRDLLAAKTIEDLVPTPYRLHP
jgi:malonate decarboxylase alpha subunit